MRPYLLFPDRDADLHRESSPLDIELKRDVELDVIIRAMACDDDTIARSGESAILAPLMDPKVIRYRQEILSDCHDNPEALRGLYRVTSDALTEGRKVSFSFFYHRAPSVVSYYARDALTHYIARLALLRAECDRHAPLFRSEGLRHLASMVSGELDDAYLESLREILAALSFQRGTLVGARLGPGNRGTGYTLLMPKKNERGWLKRIFAKKKNSIAFQLAPGDENGARALSDLRDRGLADAMTAVSQAVDHIVGFFTALRDELAFYAGAINLADELRRRRIGFCVPSVSPATSILLSARGLVNPALAIGQNIDPVGNDLSADGKSATFITGANGGGKTVLLRAIGLMQLMAQSGLFVAAESCSVSIRSGVFSHFRREEDTTMKSGKLDEELGRMSAIVDAIRPGALVLMNESFAATNEREGSEIAEGIVDAFRSRGVACVYVTHLAELASRFFRKGDDELLFLRASREADGTRSFRITEGEPLLTTYGEDLYGRIFS